MAGKRVKIVSWNVNGLNAVMRKGFPLLVEKMDADILALQETKLQEAKLTGAMKEQGGYVSHWVFSTVKKGYSGVGTYTRDSPKKVSLGLGIEKYDREGRVIEMDFGEFILFNVYFPNGQMSEERLQFKLDFYRDFFLHADALKDAGRSVIITGDFNTAHNEIDLKNPKANENTSGFLRIERDWLDRISASGWVDTFRHFHPDTVKYSWWSYRFKARERNAGWRIDYFFVSEDLIDNGNIAEAFIDNDIFGSDHCPVGIVLEI